MSVILHNSPLDNNWALVAAYNFTLLKKSNAKPNRRMLDGEDVAQANRRTAVANRRTAVAKCTQLELMLGYIAGYAPVLSPNSIKNSISLPDILQKLHEYYNVVSTGVQFLDLTSIKLLPDECHEHLYQRLTSFFDDYSNSGLWHYSPCQ